MHLHRAHHRDHAPLAACYLLLGDALTVTALAWYLYTLFR